MNLEVMSAVYYPHTEMRSVELLKTALLMWDKIEYIVPWGGYPLKYQDSLVASAIDEFGAPLTPDYEVMRAAHEFVEEFVTSPFSQDVALDRSQVWNPQQYEIWEQKFLPDTWRLLEKFQLAKFSTVSDHGFALNESVGLTLMAILADCYAGKMKARITDRGAAYAMVNSFLGYASVDNRPIRTGEIYEQLVPISLKVLGSRDLALEDLIFLRRRERERGGETLTRLRHNYVSHLSGYANTLADQSLTESDRQELLRQFERSFEIDASDLAREMNYNLKEAILSKDILVSVFSTAATIVGLAHGLPVPLAGVVNAGGAPVTIGGVLSAANKYQRLRRDSLLGHPMAYLYEAL